MKIILIPWFIILGVLKLVVFSLVVMTFPFVMLPCLLIEMGGYKDFADPVYSGYDEILSWLSKTV